MNAGQPRTQELEHFLGVLSDVKARSWADNVIRQYDKEDPYKVVSEEQMVQVIEPTPAFPIVSTCRSGTRYRLTLALSRPLLWLSPSISTKTFFASI